MWYYRDPEVYRTAGATGTPGEYSGLEDLTVWLNNKPISMVNTKFSWIQNVETNGEPGEIGRTHENKHIQLSSHTYRCEVKSNFVHGQQNFNPNQKYGIVIAGSDHYIHDNVVFNHNKPIMMEASSGGNVIAYNFVDNALIEQFKDWNESGISTHASFVHHELIEGNETPNVTIDSTHGNNGFMMIYRNFLRGRNILDANAPAAWQGQNDNGSGSLRRGVMVDFVNWEVSSIGNVLFEPTDTAEFVDAFPPDGATPPSSGNRWFDVVTRQRMYQAGFNGWRSNGVTLGEAIDDQFAWNNLHIHMDYQYHREATVNGGQPLLFENPSNPVTTLPDSLHRKTAPSYFSGFTWPPVDPTGADFAAKVSTLPAKARLAAGTQ